MERSVVRPPTRKFKGGLVIPKVVVGNHVYIGQACCPLRCLDIHPALP